MEISKTFKIVTSIALGVLFIVLLQAILMNFVNHEIKAIIGRAQFITVMESFLALSTFIVWRTFSPYLRHKYSYNISNGSAASPRDYLRKSKGSDTSLSTFNEKSKFLKQKWSVPQMILLIYIVLCHASYFTNVYFIGKEPYWFGMIAYGCLGSFVQLFTAILIGYILLFIHSLLPSRVAWRSPGNGGSGKKIICLLAVIYTIAASIYGLYNASLPPKVRNVKIPVKDFPTNLEGLSIVQISDVHLGPTVGQSKLNSIVDIVNSQNPDVVVLTGDLVDGTVKALRRAAEPLSRITSKYGNYFVSGNHEYYTGDVDNWFSYLRSLSFNVLHNSNAKIPAKITEGQGQICLAGTDDLQADTIGYKGHGFDLVSATKGCRSTDPVILLAHRPKAAFQALESGLRIDLVLSGHTHGGQIFPLMLGAYLMNPYYLGLYEAGPPGSHVYVSEGTQYWGIPMRIGTFTEITHITLNRAVV